MIRSNLALAVLAVPAALVAADRPNFVFLFADDQRYDALGVVQKEQGEKGRFPWFKTPNMDRLAADGVRFRNAFVVNCALLAEPGLLPERPVQPRQRHLQQPHAARRQAGDARLAPPRRTATRTGYVGKWHMGTQPGRPGFDWSASFTGQGTYFDADVPRQRQAREGRRVDRRPIRRPTRSGFWSRSGPRTSRSCWSSGSRPRTGRFEPPKRLANAFAGETARPVPNLGLPPGFNPDLGRRTEGRRARRCR